MVNHTSDSVIAHATTLIGGDMACGGQSANLTSDSATTRDNGAAVRGAILRAVGTGRNHSEPKRKLGHAATEYMIAWQYFMSTFYFYERRTTAVDYSRQIRGGGLVLLCIIAASSLPHSIVALCSTFSPHQGLGTGPTPMSSHRLFAEIWACSSTCVPS